MGFGNRKLRRAAGLYGPEGQELRRATFTTPLCKLCNKEVDKFELKKEDGKIKLVAHCHGDTSESPWVDEYRVDTLYSYLAFKDPKRFSLQGRGKKLPTLRDTDSIWFDPRLAIARMNRK